MADVEQHTDEIDGEPVSWRSMSADGTPTLYIHGVPNSSLTWRPFLERTGGVALDLPGFGDSVKAGTFSYSIAGYDGYLERFLDWLALERVNLVMHDWGAAALAFAQRQPARVERIVLINALPLFDGYEWHRTARIWRTPVLGELWMGCLTPRLLRRALRGANATAIPERELREIYAHFDFGTHELDAPALIVWGERDPYIPVRAAAQYADALGGESQLVALADAGHWPWLDRPDVVETVAGFLARS
jgi:pimeloyl-ACP methyl ester carboxylesterase